MAVKILSKKIVTIVLIIFQVSCSAESDPDSPGLCELKCSDAKIAGNDTRFRLVSSVQPIACNGVTIPGDSAGQEYLGPITVQFIAEKVRRLRYRKLPDKKKADEPTLDDDSAGADFTPVAGLVFEPIILRGLMAGNRTSTENATVDANGQVSPYKYAGIVTPKSEWCTDTCGVASIEIWPVCVRDSTNNVSLVLHSGALYTDETAFTVTHTTGQ